VIRAKVFALLLIFMMRTGLQALSGAHAQNVLDASLAVASFVASTAPIRCRLMTANGSGTANGTEVANGGGYTGGASAGSITFGSSAIVSTNAQSASTTAYTVTNYPRSEVVVGVELWDSAGTPVRKHWGALTASKSMASGDTFSISIGALTVAIAIA
jgi:hypothetical protein